LTVYSGRSEEYLGDVFEKFQEESGIRLNVRYADSAELAAQLLEEGGNSPADLFISQDAGSLGAVAEAGLLDLLSESILNEVPSEFSSQEKFWVGITGRTRVFAYSPSRLKDLPMSYRDVTNPIYKGRIGIAPTNGSFQAFVTALRINAGEAATEQWLRDLVANEPRYYEKNSMIVEAIDAGEIDLGLVNHYYVYEVSKALGREIGVKIGFFEKGDLGNLINVSGGGILKTSGKKEAAEKFLAYLLSSYAQETFVREVQEYPLLPGVEGPAGLPSIEELGAPLVDLNSLKDLRGTQQLLIKVGLL
ncbi:MAG: iron ABC transporter substrate-binding protein, partial [Actinobacteria bacterium]|nr:iron ABC transporter substrate-binding protein [Actinomycetota bacterium]